MSSIGNSLKNFFRTTVQIGNSASAAIVDKSVIRQALMKECGFFGMLAGMKAIRQANCNLSTVDTKNLNSRLGKTIEMIREKLTERSAHVADAKSFKVKADTSTLEKAVKDGTFKQELDVHEAEVAEKKELLKTNEDDPFADDFKETSKFENDSAFMEKYNEAVENKNKGWKDGQQGGLNNITTEIRQKPTNVINIPANNE